MAPVADRRHEARHGEHVLFEVLERFLRSIAADAKEQCAFDPHEVAAAHVLVDGFDDDGASPYFGSAQELSSHSGRRSQVC